jgi:hypothetical protein
LFVMQSREQLYALSGTGVYGRQHARSVDRGLRKVLLPHGRSHRQHAAEGQSGADWIAGTDPADGCACVGMRPVASYELIYRPSFIRTEFPCADS